MSKRINSEQICCDYCGIAKMLDLNYPVQPSDPINCPIYDYLRTNSEDYERLDYSQKSNTRTNAIYLSTRKHPLLRVEDVNLNGVETCAVVECEFSKLGGY